MKVSTLTESGSLFKGCESKKDDETLPYDQELIKRLWCVTLVGH
jgi:hypothetical protein